MKFRILKGNSIKYIICLFWITLDIFWITINYSTLPLTLSEFQTIILNYTWVFRSKFGVKRLILVIYRFYKCQFSPKITRMFFLMFTIDNLTLKN